MKRVPLRKLFGLVLAAFVLTLLPVRLSSAAVTPPDAVKTLKAENVLRNSATLTWSKVNKATGYYVYSVDPATGALTKIGSETGTSHTVKIAPGSVYSYQVFAYTKKGKKTAVSATGSPIVNVESQALRVVCTGNKCAFLEWDEIDGAKYYNLYQYFPETNTYALEKHGIKDTKWQVSSLKVGQSYSYILRSVSEVNGADVESADSNVVTVKGKKLKAVMTRRFAGTLKKNVKVTDPDTGTKITLKKGTRVSTPTVSYKKMTVMVVSTGQKVKVSGKNLKYLNELQLSKSYKEYSKNEAEAYINGEGFESKTKYLIWVNQYSSSIHFFTGSKGHWRQTRVAPCIIGNPARGYTKIGQFELLFQNQWGQVQFFWNGQKDWGQAFHGYLDSHRWGSYSAGCVRMSSADFKYVRSLPLGTKVISY